jgi:glucokinase
MERLRFADGRPVILEKRHVVAAHCPGLNESDAARGGETSVRSAIERAAEYLGIGVANVVTMLHPELVIIGGGVAALGDLLLETVRATVCRRVRMFPPESVSIEISTLGDQAGLYGAIALAMKQGKV